MKYQHLPELLLEEPGFLPTDLWATPQMSHFTKAAHIFQIIIFIVFYFHSLACS